MKTEKYDDNIRLDNTNPTENTALTSNSSLWNGREIGVWEKSWGNCCSCCCNLSCVCCSAGATLAIGSGILLCVDVCSTSYNPLISGLGGGAFVLGCVCLGFGVYRNATYIPPMTYTEQKGNYLYTYRSEGGNIPSNEGKNDKEWEISTMRGKEFAHKWCCCC